VLIFLMVVGFIIYSFRGLTQVPSRVSLRIPAAAEPLKKESAKPKDIQFIYERDPFATFRPTPPPLKPAEILPVLPPPPAPKALVPPVKPIIQFLEPLPIKITGIIHSSNEAKSQVTLINTNTKKSETHKVGEKIFDAYIIRIFPRKIILIRSNGQQETLFMYPADAQAEIKAIQDTSWSNVIQKQSETSYLVNPKTFVERIGNLARFIEMLDLTTAFKQGESIGCRIGKMDEKSIGYALGLVPGDIVTLIQAIKPSSTSNRIKIYNTLADLSIGDKVNVELLRRGKQFTYEYTLFPVGETVEQSIEQPALKTASLQDIRAKHYKTLERYNYHAEIKERKEYAKHAMQNYGNRHSVLKNVHQRKLDNKT
jgi:type II secretory pathway component PulC